MEKREAEILNIEQTVGIILDIINPVLIIIVMLLIKDKIHSLVDYRVIEGIGYIFSGFSILIPFLAKRIFLKIKNVRQAKMVVFVLLEMPYIFGFVYFLLGGSLRYSIGFCVLTMGYFLFGQPFMFGERK